MPKLRRAGPARAARRSVRAISRRLLIVALLGLAVAGGASGVLVGGDGGRGEPSVPASGTARVVRVVDGDTVILTTLGRSRLIGIDTPEVHGRRECFGPQASQFAAQMLERRRVRYEIGPEPRDRYGRALVYLWLSDGRFVNELIVERGYARPLAIAPNVRYASRFAQDARRARAERRGLWSLC